MEKEPQHSLEELIDRELSKLPERPAPETLLPRVLARIEARQRRHWWQRPWTDWPLGAQVASVSFMLACVAGAVLGASALSNAVFETAELMAFSDALDSASMVWDLLGALGNAVLVLGRAAGQQWVLAGIFLPIAMYLACVGLGTLCFRLAYANVRRE